MVTVVLGVDNGDIGGILPILFDAIVSIGPLASSGQAKCVHIAMVNVMVDMVVLMFDNWLVNNSGTNHSIPTGVVVKCALGIDGGDCRHAHYEVISGSKG